MANPPYNSPAIWPYEAHQSKKYTKTPKVHKRVSLRSAHPMPTYGPNYRFFQERQVNVNGHITHRIESWPHYKIFQTFNFRRAFSHNNRSGFRAYGHFRGDKGGRDLGKTGVDTIEGHFGHAGKVAQ